MHDPTLVAACTRTPRTAYARASVCVRARRAGGATLAAGVTIEELAYCAAVPRRPGTTAPPRARRQLRTIERAMSAGGPANLLVHGAPIIYSIAPRIPPGRSAFSRSVGWGLGWSEGRLVDGSVDRLMGLCSHLFLVILVICGHILLLFFVMLGHIFDAF